MKHSILIADDDSRILTALKFLLKGENYQVTTVTSPKACLQILQKNHYSLALVDLNYHADTTSGDEGLTLIADIKKLDEQLPVIVMTGYSSIEIAVEAMKLGAVDFVQKPWGNDRLLSVIQAQIRIGDMQHQGIKLAQENALLRDQVSAKSAGIIAHSSKMQQLLAQLEKLARSDMNILLTGENGTGKSMFADYLHQCSGRDSKPFIAVNMGAISESLFESEMFGHVKGAFTDAKDNRIGRFELAEGGTLFLDEIANIPSTQQAKLLHVLEAHQFEKVGSSKTQRVDVRIVSATNSNLAELIEQGQFRQDLLYRLNTVEITIPPLRERLADIIPLAQYFLAQHAEKYRLSAGTFAAQALEMLQNYTWPGNIRELNHMIERAIFLRQGDVITVADLGLNNSIHEQAANKKLENTENIDINNASLDVIEKTIIEQRLEQFKHNGQATASSLGLSRSAYYRRLEKHNLTL
ncbi:MAG: sigma-54-dependent Fis family transcriptional regulator [Paraglaciecola sp.]|nr:sigma-54-dependent Fis family transcriptional regulator [Paraglaciecola sp.]